MTFSLELIQSLAADPTLGAGNFLQKICERVSDLDTPLVFVDAPAPLAPVGAASSLSLRELLLVSEYQAGWLEGIGVESKDPVGLWFDDGIDYLVSYLAVTRLGAIAVSANGGLERQVATEFFQHTGCRLVLSRGARADELRSLLPEGAGFELHDLDRVRCEGPAIRPPFTHTAFDPVLIGHSSGTTGRPKAVQFNHEGFSFGVKQELSKQIGTRVLSALPHSHGAALSIAMSALLRGASLRLQTQKSPAELAQAIADFRADLVCAFPKVFVDLCRANPDPGLLGSVSHWLSTGDANHETHIRRLMSYGRRRNGAGWIDGSAFIDNLGSSEFGFAAFRNVHTPERERGTFERRIGRPFAWMEAEVLGDDGRVLPARRVGKLGVKSPTVTAGYWNDSVLTERNRLSGFWLTGDLAYRTEDGVFYHVDRIGDAFEIDGQTVYSCQLEELLLRTFPDIFECSIVGVEEEPGQRTGVLIAELATECDSSTLLERVNAALAAQGRPRLGRLMLEEARCSTGITGKKLKRTLREQFRPAHVAARRPPREYNRA